MQINVLNWLSRIVINSTHFNAKLPAGYREAREKSTVWVAQMECEGGEKQIWPTQFDLCDFTTCDFLLEHKLAHKSRNTCTSWYWMLY